MRKRIVAVAVILALLLGMAALAEDYYHIAVENEEDFGQLLLALVNAFEKPSKGDAEAVTSILERIRAVSEGDYQVGLAIATHWRDVCVNPDGKYPFYLYQGGEAATELAQVDIPDRPTHAFVVLGFELKNGEMRDELKGRCDAAAAAAKVFPSTIIICSGGATGDNNPDGHTEAGLMKDYLVNRCGIDADRIFTDETAMTTLQNAVNSFEIMRAQGVETITIVTSSYHQKRGQVLYNAMAALYRQEPGYSVEIVGNYSYPVKASERFRQDDRTAAMQLAAMLRLPEELTDALGQTLGK